MRRRGVLAGIAASSLGAGVSAQPARRVWRIGFLSGRPKPASLDGDPHGAFMAGMGDLGLVEGKDYTVEWRFAGGEFERLPALAAELVALPVDVLVTSPAVASRAAQKATSTVPVIFAYVSDPVSSGLVASLARPGGNVTGLSVQLTDVAPKLLQLLGQLLPRLTRVAVLTNPTNAGSAVLATSVEAAVRQAGAELLPLPAADPDAVERSLLAGRERGADAVLVLPDPFFASQRARIASLALERRLPSAFADPDYVAAGGLLSYGDPLGTFIRRTAYYAHRIMQGATPAELPVQQPTRFQVALNLRTAKALGLTVPATLLAQADEVIE